MNTKCLNCDKDICQTDGKRERLYCSDTCRAEYNQKQKRKTIAVPIEHWQSNVIEFVKAQDGQWTLVDGTKGNFVWAKDKSMVEASNLPPIKNAFKVKEDEVIDHEKANQPHFKSEMEREIWEDEQRILNSKNK